MRAKILGPLISLGLSLGLAAPAAALKRRTPHAASQHAPRESAAPSRTAPPVAELARVTTDRELSLRYMDKGLAYLAAGDNLSALVEFDLASGFQSSPALDFNMGRCHERLDHVDEAIAAYERFLRAAPDDPQAAAARERIAVLRRQVASSAGAASPGR